MARPRKAGPRDGRGRLIPQAVAPTPERMNKPDGHTVSVPTETAGISTNRLVPAWERLLSRGIISDRHATAAASYVRAWEKMEGAGFAPSVLLKAGARVDVSFMSGEMPVRVIRTASRFRRVCETLGPDLFLVDAVCRLDLTPARSWQQARLRAALGRLADVMGH